MKKLLTLLFAASFPFLYSTPTLNPSSAITIATDQNYYSYYPPIVQTNKFNEILIAWSNGNITLGSLSPTNAYNWSNNVVLFEATILPFLAANDSGFVLTFIDPNTNIPSSLFYNSSLEFWGSEIGVLPI